MDGLWNIIISATGPVHLTFNLFVCYSRFYAYIVHFMLHGFSFWYLPEKSDSFRLHNNAKKKRFCVYVYFMYAIDIYMEFKNNASAALSLNVRARHACQKYQYLSVVCCLNWWYDFLREKSKIKIQKPNEIIVRKGEICNFKSDVYYSTAYRSLLQQFRLSRD